MKINVSVYNEYVRINDNCSTFNSGNYEVKPYKIIRSATGRVGKARNRYYYEAHFIGFGDMLNCLNKSLNGLEARENIVRKQNPKFNPKKLNWVGNVAIVK